MKLVKLVVRSIKMTKIILLHRQKPPEPHRPGYLKRVGGTWDPCPGSAITWTTLNRTYEYAKRIILRRMEELGMLDVPGPGNYGLKVFGVLGKGGAFLLPDINGVNIASKDIILWRNHHVIREDLETRVSVGRT
jgi:hypothetical protein